MKKLLALSVLALVAVGLVACGGGGGSGGTSTVKVTADPSGKPKFNPTSLTADAGKVTIQLSNPTSTPQDVAVKDSAGKVYGITNGGKYVTNGTASVTVDLDSGSYIYYSTHPGDEAAGMQGTLTVK
jgi:plastocyanin